MGTTGRVLGFGEFREQPFHAGWIQRRVYLNGGVAGDGRGDAGAHGFEVFPLGFAFTLLQHLNQHALQLIALEPNGGGLDGDGARAEGFGVKAVALQFSGDRGEDNHLLRQEIDQHGHEQALALDTLDLALAQDFLKQDALVGDVLIDDPQAFVVDGEDERFAHLTEGLEGGERIEIRGRKLVLVHWRLRIAFVGGLGHGGGDDLKSGSGKGQFGRNGRRLGRAELEGRGLAGQGFRSCGDGLSGERRDILQKRGGDGRCGVGAGGKGLQKSCGRTGLNERVAKTVPHEIVDMA